MRTTIRLAALAGSVLLWLVIPSFGQTNPMASFSMHATSIGSSESWSASAFAAVILFNDSHKPNSKDSLFADGHLRNSNDDRRNLHDDRWNSNDNSQGGNGQGGNGGCQDGNSQGSGCGKRVSAPEGGTAMNYLLLAGIACFTTIYLKRKQWAGRHLD